MENEVILLRTLQMVSWFGRVEFEGPVVGCRVEYQLDLGWRQI